MVGYNFGDLLPHQDKAVQKDNSYKGNTMLLPRPTPTHKEIKLDPKKFIVSKTDKRGIITFANDYFSEVCGYKEFELVGAPHSIVRHPDMPKAVFFLLWQYIQNGRNIMAVVKNLAKNGDHYWVVTDFDIARDSNGKIVEYTAFRQAAPKPVISAIEPIYQKLIEIEKEQNMDASIKYLERYLKDQGLNYDQFIEQLAKPKGIMGILFAKMKKLLS